jgi:hypothetical protein
MLQAFVPYYELTNKQLNRVVYRGDGEAVVRRTTKKLFELGLLNRLTIPTETGTRELLYSLSTRGIRYLREEMGLDVSHRKTDPIKIYFIEHTRAINDFLIAAQHLARRDLLAVEGVLHDQELKRNPFVVRTAKEKRLVIWPDAWVHFRWTTARGPKHSRVWLEIDRGTEPIARIRQKVRGILAVADPAKGDYRRRFGTNNITVAFIATPGEKRAFQLLEWIEQELEALSAKGEADLFRVSPINPDGADPEFLLVAPHWRAPFGREATQLLPIESYAERMALS